jgi:hypothetical protein
VKSIYQRFLFYFYVLPGAAYFVVWDYIHALSVIYSSQITH